MKNEPSPLLQLISKYDTLVVNAIAATPCDKHIDPRFKPVPRSTVHEKGDYVRGLCKRATKFFQRGNDARANRTIGQIQMMLLELNLRSQRSIDNDNR